MRSRILIAFCALALGLLVPVPVQADKIDATPGRKYKLTKQHGPWMIMVATLYEPPPDRKKAGLTHEEAADKLVYELRKLSIPAYTFSMDEVTTPIETTDRQGRASRRSYRSQKGGICVVAGNYSSTEDSVAKKTLEFIKTYVPKSWKDDAAFRPTPGKPNPLSGAFLSINPMLAPEEVASRKRDSLLLKLNAGSEYSIMENKGKFTLVIATFTGKSQTAVGSGGIKKAMDEFEVSTGSLDEAAARAWKVAKMLREGMIDGRNRGKKYDAFVFHERYQSVVTVGSFYSKTDPRIAQMVDVFGAKTIAGPNGKPLLAGEGIVIPGATPDPVIFDPKPKLIDVPLLKPEAAAKPATTGRSSILGGSKTK